MERPPCRRTHARAHLPVLMDCKRVSASELSICTKQRATMNLLSVSSAIISSSPAYSRSSISFFRDCTWGIQRQVPALYAWKCRDAEQLQERNRSRPSWLLDRLACYSTQGQA